MIHIVHINQSKMLEFKDLCAQIILAIVQQYSKQ